MVDIFPKLSEILPNADDLLSLEPEELAGPLLVSLQGSDYINPAEIISYEHLENAEIKEYLAGGADDILRALMQAWQWLEREGFVALRPASLSRETDVMRTGITYFVTNRGKKIAQREDLDAYRKANLLPKGQLHPIIAQKVWSLFLRGDYDCAVFQAFKEVEIAVRSAGNYDGRDIGVDLMRKAFGNGGALTDPNQASAEQQARSNLFAGAIGSYKNPFSHRTVFVSAEEAAEMIIFASHLLRIVDSRSHVSK